MHHTLLLLAAIVLIFAYGHMNLATTRIVARHAGVPEADLACPSLWGCSSMMSASTPAPVPDVIVPSTTGGFEGAANMLMLPNPRMNPNLRMADVLTAGQRFEQRKMAETTALARNRFAGVRGSEAILKPTAVLR